jgi:hypothetical protein
MTIDVSYSEEAAPWPSEVSATADDLIKHFAASVLIEHARSEPVMHAYMDAEKGDPEHGRLAREWMLSIIAMIGAAHTAHALIFIRKHSPALADALARELVEYTEDGGLYTELAWDWLEERHVDPQRIITEFETALAEVYRPSDVPAVARPLVELQPRLIHDVEGLDAVLMEACETVVVRTRLNELFLVNATTEDGRIGYQGFPSAEDEDGDDIDPNSGWAADWPATVWPLTYVATASPRRRPKSDPGNPPALFMDGLL